jgi:hypothetical protein
MVLPSSLLEEEDELLSLRSFLSINLPISQCRTSQPPTYDQLINPLLGPPVPPYIVVARVTTVIGRLETRATLQTGAGSDGRDP